MAGTVDFWKGRRLCVVLDGNVSAGKSTLTADLCAGNADAVPISESGHGGGVLDAYLKAPKELSAMFQVHMLQACVYRDQLAMVQPGAALTVVDRSITGNAVFALTNHVLAGASASSSGILKRAEDPPISVIEYEFYKTLYRQAMFDPIGIETTQLGAFQHGDISVFLHVSARNCIERCKKRGFGSEDASYDVGYFEGVEIASMVALLENLSKKRPHPQIILDWSDSYGTLANFDRIMKTYLQSPIKHQQRVRLTRSRPWEIDNIYKEYRAVLDFSDARCEEEFFSYENVSVLFDLLCQRRDYDVARCKPLCICVPANMSERPWNGTFVLTID